MLRRAQRLRTDEFKAMIEKGKTFHTPLFIVRILDQKTTGRTKVAAVAPQKIARTAVKRNSLRRKIYRAIEPSVPRLRNGLFIGIFAKQPTLLAKTDQITSDIDSLFVKAEILR